MQRLNGWVAADSRGSASVTDSDLVVARLRPHVALSHISRAVALSYGNHDVKHNRKVAVPLPCRIDMWYLSLEATFRRRMVGLPTDCRAASLLVVTNGVQND